MEIIKKTLVVLILWSLIVGTVPVSVLAQQNSPGNQIFEYKELSLSEGVEYAPGEFIVQFKPGVSNREIANINSKHGTSVIYTSPNAGFKRLHVPNGKSVRGMVEKYKNSPYVEYAEPNYKVYVDATIPNDHYFSLLWGMHNTGQSGVTTDADIDAPEAWDITTGSSDIIVAVIDTGVDYNHPDLAANMWTNPDETLNGIDDDGNGYIDDIRGWDFFSDDNDPYDESGHGTHCSGTIAAEGNNDMGVVGVSWNAKIMPLRFLGPEGGYTSDAVLAINYAIDNGADIMSNSWGGGGYSKALENAIYAANDAGILFVAAAGNAGTDNDEYPHYPSSYDVPNIVSVAATDRYDNLAYFSCYGLESVDLGAPGVTIASTYPDNSYCYMSGTSMAAPHVAGAAALIKAQYPDITVDALKARLLESTDSISSLDGKTVTGGRLNINNCFNVYIQPELSVIVTSPTIANIDESFAVEAIISNSGTETATGVNATINLLKGLSLATGESQTKPTDDIINGDSATVSWTVNADTVGTYNITVEASATNTATTSGTANVDVITPDTTPPTVTLTAPLDSAYITTELYTVTATASDNEFEVALVEFKYLPYGGLAWISIGMDTISPYEVKWDLGAIDDQTGIQVKAIAMNYAELTAEDVNSGITHDATPPTATISINDGTEYTTTTGVELTLTYSDTISGIADCRYSNESSSWSDWETCAGSRTWTLTGGDGTKTVYCEVRDNAGNVEQVTDTIVLDTTPPTGSVAINDGAIYTTSPNVTLTMSAADANGVAEIMVSNNGTFSDAVWEPYIASKLWTLTTDDGDKTVYVKYKDKAGFESTACSDDIILDTTAPARVQDLVVTTISSSELGISWAGNTKPDFQQYTVYRSTISGGSYDLVASTTTNSSSDTELTASTTYYYKITATDEAGNEGVLSVEASGTTEAAENVMQIDSIEMSTARIRLNGWYTYAMATVTIVDTNDNPVAGATVSGRWSVLTSDTDSGTTGLDGKITLDSNSVKNAAGTFTFTVDSVALDGWTYDTNANIETTDSITV